MDATATTPAGTFQHCLDVRESSPPEKGSSHKQHGPEVGMIRDEEFVLVKVEHPQL